MSRNSINPSGFPEYLPPMQIVVDRFMSVFTEHATRHGYAHIETPAVEYMDTLASRGEISKEIYTIGRARAEDSGDSSEESDRGLRFDLTVPFARYVAQHQNDLFFPFRRYQLQKVWRGERPQKGRFREFYQADIDVVSPGSLPLYFDAEVARVMSGVLAEFAIGPITMRINNREFLDGLLESFGLPMSDGVLQSIDKLDKVGVERVAAELVDTHGQSSDAVHAMLQLITQTIPRAEIDDFLSGIAPANEKLVSGADAIRAVFADLPEETTEHSVRFVFDPRIARGLDYYTGTVYETTIDGLEKYGSICSGGRYADLASRFTQQTLPGVGLSIGLTRLLSVAESEGLIMPQQHTLSHVVVCLVDGERESASIQCATRLRDAGYRVETNHKPKIGLGKQIATAAEKGVPYAVVVEADERITLYEVGQDRKHAIETSDELIEHLRACKL